MALSAFAFSVIVWGSVALVLGIAVYEVVMLWRDARSAKEAPP